MITQDALSNYMMRLANLRVRHRALAREIKILKRAIRALGGEPSGKLDLSGRNNDIYRAYQAKISLEVLSESFGLSKNRIKDICKRIEVQQRQ